MRNAIRFCVAVMLAATASVASAAFHLFTIEQIYSNADGTIQFVVLTTFADGENFWKGRVLTSGDSNVRRTFQFPTDLPDGFTGGKEVLVATQGFAALGIITPDFVVPNNFIATGAGYVNFADVYQLGYKAGELPTDGINALYAKGAVVKRNLATNYAGQSVSLGGTAALNFSGLWYKAPADSESGWGINFAHQGDVIFASWFTYDLTGKGWWLVMAATNTGGNTFTGTLLEATGPAFDSVPFPPLGSPGGIVASTAGSGTLTFTDVNNGTFTYTVKGISQSKAITRQVFGPLPTCVFSAQNNLASASNYQDLWYAAPADSESGWGINFSNQGDKIFATWYTFDRDRTPMWLVATADKTAPGIYTGTLYRLTGPPFNSTPFPPIGSPGGAVATSVGTMTVTFSDGNNARFAYTVGGVSQTKSITRQVFRTPGTVCQ